MKHIQRLRKVVTLSVKLEWLDKDPFLKYKCKFTRSERTYLSEEDLATIENKIFAVDRLTYIQDLFIFSCYTGMSYIDVVNLLPSDIVMGIDGSKWIYTKRLKNEAPIFNDIDSEIKIKKLPYKFYYHYTDENDRTSKMMIEDWEIGQLFWNCLARADGDEAVALQKVKEKYDDDFLSKKDIHLFLGTTKQFHQKRAKNPFVIIGVFYPKKEDQLSLFPVL